MSVAAEAQGRSGEAVIRHQRREVGFFGQGRLGRRMTASPDPPCSSTESPHPDAATSRHSPQEGVVGAPDLIGQFLDIAAGQLRVDARSAGILQFDLGSL
jgi:hypothetical protein